MASNISEKESEESFSIYSENESEVEDMNAIRKWNRSEFFELVNEKWKCKSCNNVYNLKISSNILKRHHKNNHEIRHSRKISDFFKSDTKDFRKILIKFIVNGGHPFNIVEEPDFKILLQCLSPKIEIPSRMTVQRDILKDFNDFKLKMISKFNENCFQIAITTDIWTSIANRPYVSITAHFIDNKRILQRVLLDFSHIPHPHTGEEIKNILLDTFENYKIQDKIISITTDNAANNKKGVKLLNTYLENYLKVDKVCHFPCFGHVLNLSINDGIKDISNILSNLRLIGSAIKNSSKKLKYLKKQLMLSIAILSNLRDIYIFVGILHMI
jgi:hypothetical protein